MWCLCRWALLQGIKLRVLWRRALRWRGLRQRVVRGRLRPLLRAMRRGRVVWRGKLRVRLMPVCALMRCEPVRRPQGLRGARVHLLGLRGRWSGMAHVLVGIRLLRRKWHVMGGHLRLRVLAYRVTRW